MKLLVVGGGAREHALAWKLQQSPAVERVFVCPGNAGIALEPGVECVAIAVSDQNKMVEFCREKEISFVVVGPDQALADGLVDRLEKEGNSAFGPTAAAAKIESSKAFAKEIMTSVGIPTAEFSSFQESAAAKKFVQESKWAGWVVKADGLALGKGVVVCHKKEEALQAIHDFLDDKKLGTAGTKIIVEELLIGREVSAFHLCDGKESRFLGFACDYKQLQDGGKGPNTGGMGAYSPADWVAGNLVDDTTNKIVLPLLREMQKRNTSFRGMLFTGLMITADGPKVLEFNARLGDPETQVLLPRMNEDLLPWLQAAASGKLHSMPAKIAMKNSIALHVVMASPGYPSANIRKGDAIAIREELFPIHSQSLSERKIFFAGVSADKQFPRELKTAGGRVLGLTVLASSRAQARTLAYENIKKIHFEGAQMRGDIGE